jgi:hypothetical protein
MLRSVLAFSAVASLALASGLQQQSHSATSPQNSQLGAPTKTSELHALASLEPIDTHTHVAKGDASFYAMLDRLHMHILDILLVDDDDSYRRAMEPQLEDALRVVRESHGHAALCTSFNPFQFGQAPDADSPRR